MERGVELTLQEFYDFLISDNKFYGIFVDDNKQKYCINCIKENRYIHLEYKTTSLDKNKFVDKTEMINELFPLLRRKKIIKILNHDKN